MLSSEVRAGSQVAQVGMELGVKCCKKVEGIQITDVTNLGQEVGEQGPDKF